jgi:hypothetical protein
VLPTDQFKQFESSAAARNDKPGSPLDPHTGDQCVFSQIGDVSYKRLTREISVPASGGSLTFWTSYDTDLHGDHLFATPHSLLLGFGLEGDSTEAERNAVMGRALDHLLE